MSNFDIIKDEKKGVVNYVLNFEEAITKLPVVIFNSKFVEFPNMVLFTKEDQGFLSDISLMLQNPGLETLKVEPNEIEDMIKVIEKEEKNVVILNSRKLSPERKIRLNLEKLKNDLVYARDYGNTLIFNDILITSSELEFHGSGMFSGRLNVFYVLETELELIKNFLLK